MKQIHPILKNIYFCLADLALCFAAYAVMIIFIFPVTSFGIYVKESLHTIGQTALVYIVVQFLFKMHRVYWTYGSSKEYLRLLLACVVACAINIFVDLIHIRYLLIYPKFTLAANFLTIIFIVGFRVSIRLLQKVSNMSELHHGKRVLIIGAGQLAMILLRDLRDNERLHYDVVGLIDDDKRKRQQIMYGAEVIGGRYDIERICRRRRVEEIIFAISVISKQERNELLEICTRTGCNIKMMPGVEAVLAGKVSMNSMRNIEIEDLLERDPIAFDNDKVREDLYEKTVLVTGGSGSIGSELCRQIIRFAPKKLIILDIYENTTYELENELREKYPTQDLTVLIASVRDKKRLESIFEMYRPDVVFHAAAHKHVPLMEESPGDAVKNNVFGTHNVASCADKYGTKRFVLISTDKAVNPTNVMGATKRMCEMIIQTFAKESSTEFVAVRFGNVLGSNGSVIPRFKKQIAAGGPVTVTHPEITRFFMTIPEAARLVLQAAVFAKGGEIFVLDMGQPVKIYELAKKMIRLAGYRPGEDIPIEVTGLRPGEKLYEELLMDEEGLRKTEHRKIFIGNPINITPEQLKEKLDILSEALEKGNDATVQALKKVVPTFRDPEPEPPIEEIDIPFENQINENAAMPL